MFSVVNKLHKWSPTLLLIIDDDAAVNRGASLTQSFSRSIAQAIHTHNISHILVKRGIIVCLNNLVRTIRQKEL